MGCTQQKGGGQQSGFVNVDVADQGCSEVGFSGQINPSIGGNAGLFFAPKKDSKPGLILGGVVAALFLGVGFYWFARRRRA